MKFFSNLLTLFIVIGFVLIGIMLVVANNQCDHNETQTRYVFVAEDSPSNSDVAKFCKECGERVTNYSLFKGTPTDKSYLSAIVEHSDSNEIIPGEYYTVTAIVPLGFYAYGSNSVWLTCEVKNDAYIVRFNVEFREGFKDLISSIEKGEEITFRGKFYAEGCGFTDCELITRNDQSNGGE